MGNKFVFLILLILLGCSTRSADVLSEKFVFRPDIAEMTLEQKIAQMVMVRVSGC